MSFIFEAIGENPPSIFIIAGVFLIALGAVGGYPSLVTIGILCFVAAFVLQIVWLLRRQ